MKLYVRLYPTLWKSCSVYSKKGPNKVMPSRGSIQESDDVLTSSSFFTSDLISRQEENKYIFWQWLVTYSLLETYQIPCPIYCMSIFGFPLRAVNRWIPKVLRYIPNQNKMNPTTPTKIIFSDLIQYQQVYSL